MNTTVKEVKQNKKVPHVNLKAALTDLDVLIEHFSDPSYNQAQVRLMRRIRQQVLAAVEQLKKSGARA